MCSSASWPSACAGSWRSICLLRERRAFHRERHLPCFFFPGRCFLRGLSKDKASDPLLLLQPRRRKGEKRQSPSALMRAGALMRVGFAAGRHRAGDVAKLVREQRETVLAACGGDQPSSSAEERLCEAEVESGTARFRCELAAAHRSGIKTHRARLANCTK